VCVCVCVCVAVCVAVWLCVAVCGCVWLLVAVCVCVCVSLSLWACVSPPLTASEAIAAARLIGTTQLILVHGQATPAGVTVRVKSVDAAFSRALVAIAATALA
ncbi:MAG: hypothetical protein P4L40_04995, partial [Terracidiphilus sp.]|nr:hypothetical protein [Terracidiphilus sp.]